MSQILKKHQINLVDPKFRPLVEETWKRGEDVPFSATKLKSNIAYSNFEINLTIELIRKYGWDE